MFTSWTEFGGFLRERVNELAQTQFDQVRYADMGLALSLLVLVSVVALFTLIRLSLTARRHARQHSGHGVGREHQRGRGVVLVYNAPKVLLGVALAGLAVALSDPFLTETEEVAGDVESRVRIDLVDTSLSMTWELPPTGRSRAEVAREAHLSFLEMRREKNDRVSLWMFSSFPYMVDDFVLDDELYYFQVMDAPYATVRILAPESGARRDEFFVPRDKVRFIPTEGSTDIVQALRAVTKHFDQDAALGGTEDTHRALLIVTDADVDEVPGSELAGLATRNVVPYIIFINAGAPAVVSRESGGEPPLIGMIREFGGESFDVRDQDSLEKAYRAIDEQETVRVEVSHRAHRVPIYSRFLLLSMVLLVVGIPAGFAAELLWGLHP